jgi:hypothetical protein
MWTFPCPNTLATNFTSLVTLPQPKRNMHHKAAQDSGPPDKTPELVPNGKKCVQQIVGSFMYYRHAVNTTILKALNSLLQRQQSSPTEATATCTNQLLDYLATHPKATVRFYESNMLLQVHSDASYLKLDGCSTAVGHYFLGKLPIGNQPIVLSKHVAASVAEAKLRALFLKTQEVKIL